MSNNLLNRFGKAVKGDVGKIEGAVKKGAKWVADKFWNAADYSAGLDNNHQKAARNEADFWNTKNKP